MSISTGADPLGPFAKEAGYGNPPVGGQFKKGR